MQVESPQAEVGAAIMKRILRNKWFWVLVILVAIGATIAWRWWPRTYELTVSYETTRLTGPLNPDGTVNYVAALNEMYGEGVTPDNNAAVLLLQAVGPDVMPPSVRARTFELMGMAPPKNGNYFVSLGDYAQAKSPPAEDRPKYELDTEMREKVRKAMAAPWSAKDDPLLAEWLKSIAKPLDIVAAASMRPRCHVPLVSPSSPPIALGIEELRRPFLDSAMDVGKALAARAMLRAGQGRIDDACEDLLGAHRLARLIAQGPTLLGTLSGRVIENTASEGSTALANSGRLSAEQARALLGQLNSMGPLRDVIEAIDRCDRFAFLDMAAAVARATQAGATEAPELTKWLNVEIPVQQVDVDDLCRRFNQSFDGYVKANRTEPFSARQAAHTQWVNAINPYRPSLVRELLGKEEPARPYSEQIVADVMLPLGACRRVQDKCLMRSRLARTAMALAAFRAEKGAYPEALSELEGEYFTEVPEDLFAEGPLTYRRTAKGYLLYSVGQNAVDDGGVHDYRDGDIVISVGSKPKPKEEPE